MRPGTVSLPKGLWSRHTLNGSTANALAPDTLTDLGAGACFNDARVEVGTADGDRPMGRRQATLGSNRRFDMSRMVHCVKFGKELPGLDSPPWPGELGERIFNNVSLEAWRLWEDRMRMILNEYRLLPFQKEAQELMARQMTEFFFGEGPRCRATTCRPPAK